MSSSNINSTCSEQALSSVQAKAHSFCLYARACARCIGDPAIFDKYFGSKYRSLVLAVGGNPSIPGEPEMEHCLTCLLPFLPISIG